MSKIWDSSLECEKIIDMEDLTVSGSNNTQCQECGQDLDLDVHGFCSDEWQETD